MALYNKIKWVLGILMILSLIVITNLIDRNNFIRVKESVETIYEDRLIAKELIFEMYKAIQEKELALALEDTTFFNQRNKTVNNAIKGLVVSFEQTKLTLEEGKVFKSLKTDLQTLEESETVFATSGFKTKDKLRKQILDIKEKLYMLSKIQVNEGKRQMSISKKAIDTVELFTQIEIYVLVFLAIVIQIIIMYNPKSSK